MPAFLCCALAGVFGPACAQEREAPTPEEIQAAETAPHDDARSFFKHLVQIETGHKKLLEAEYDYYAANGFYFDQREFSLEM